MAIRIKSNEGGPRKNRGCLWTSIVFCILRWYRNDGWKRILRRVR